MIHSIIKGLRSFYYTVVILFTIFMILVCFFHTALTNSIVFIKSELKKDNTRIELIENSKDPFDLVNSVLENIEGKDF